MDIITQPEDDYAYLYSRDNPESLVNLLSTKLSRAVMGIPREYLELEEEDFKLTKTDRALRVTFWREYNKARLTGTKMHPLGIYNGICTDKTFFKLIVANPKKMAWLVKPILEDEVKLHLLYEKGLKRVEEILDSDIQTVTGMLDPKKADVVLKAYAMIENRVKGLAIQRIEKKSLSVKVEEKVTDENREDRIKRLKEKYGKFPELQQDR